MTTPEASTTGATTTVLAGTTGVTCGVTGLRGLRATGFLVTGFLAGFLTGFLAVLTAFLAASLLVVFLDILSPKPDRVIQDHIYLDP